MYPPGFFTVTLLAPSAYFVTPPVHGGQVDRQRADDRRPCQKFHKIFIVNRLSGMVQWSPR